MGKTSKYFLFVVLLFALYSCASSIPHSDVVHQAWAESKWHDVNLDEGRKLYSSNCAGCHMLHAPSEHTETEWITLFDEMASKAHMTMRDSISVLAYLVTYSKGNELENK